MDQDWEAGFFAGYEECYDDLTVEEPMPEGVNPTTDLLASALAERGYDRKLVAQLREAKGNLMDLADRLARGWANALDEMDRRASEHGAREARRENRHKEEVLGLQVALNRQARRIAELEEQLSRHRPGGRVLSDNGVVCDLDVPGQPYYDGA